MGTVLSTFSSNDTNDCGSTLVDRYSTLVTHPHQHHHHYHQHVHPPIRSNLTNIDRKSVFDSQTLNYDQSNHAYLYEDLDTVNDCPKSPTTGHCRDRLEDQNLSDTSKLTNSMNMLSLKRLIFPNLSRKSKTGTGLNRQSCKTSSSLLMSRSEYRSQKILSDGFENFEARDPEIPIYYYPNGTKTRVPMTKWPHDLQRNYGTRTSARYTRTDVSQVNPVGTVDYEQDKLASPTAQQLGLNQRHVRFNPKRQLSEPNGHFRPQMTSCGSGEDLTYQQIQPRVLYTYTPSLIDLRRVNRCSDSQSLDPNSRSINRNNSLHLPLSPYVSSRSSADVQICPRERNRILTESDFCPEGLYGQGDSHLCTYDTSPAARSCTYNFESRITYDGLIPFEPEFQDNYHQAMDRSHGRPCSTPQSNYHSHVESYADKQNLVQLSPVHIKKHDQVKSDLAVPIQALRTHNECSKSLTKSISCYALKFFNYHSTQPRMKKSTESEAFFKIPKKRESSFVERTRKSQPDKRRSSHILTRKDKHNMNISTIAPITTNTTIDSSSSSSHVLTTNPITLMTNDSKNTNNTSTGYDNMDNSNSICSNIPNQRANHTESGYGDLQQQQHHHHHHPHNQQQHNFEWNKTMIGKPLSFNSSFNYIQSKENGIHHRYSGTTNPNLLGDNHSDVIDLKPNHLSMISNDVIAGRNNLNRCQWIQDSICSSMSSTSTNPTQTGSFCSHHTDFLLRQPIYKASTSELLRCLSFFIVTRIQLRLTHGQQQQHQHRSSSSSSSSLKNLQPSIIVAWIRAIDRALLLQGWSEVAFINPIHVVFLFMMLRDFVDSDITTEQELHTIIMACLYLAYSYMGNEISYPLKPFLVAETNQLIAHTDNDKKVLTTEHALIHGHENSIKSKVIDEVRNRFWQYVLRILNAKSSEMLRINADPVLFTELFGELKSYENAFTMPVKIPMRSTNRPL